LFRKLKHGQDVSSHN